MWGADSLGETLMLGKFEGKRWRRWQRMRWLDGVSDSMDMSLSKVWGDGQGTLACCNPWVCKESDTIEWLNWTEFSSELQRNPCFLATSELNYEWDVPPIPQGRGKAWWNSVWTESAPLLPQGEWSATPVVMLWPTASYTTPPYRGGQIWFPSLYWNNCDPNLTSLGPIVGCSLHFEMLFTYLPRGP